jgi:hypothetical protein
MSLTKYKDQAMSGPINVRFGVASITYNMFHSVRIKYHDPINENFRYDKELIKNLSKQYYQGIKEYLNKEIFEIKREFINEKNYYRLTLSPKFEFKKFYFPYPPFYRTFEVFSILIDIRVTEFAKEGLYDFEMKPYKGDRVFIDSDGIGVILL